MLTVYHAPFTRSHLVRFVLEELSLPHEIVRLDLTRGEHKSPRYLAIHPLGQVPALVDEGRVILECGAIALHLADKAPEKRLAPAVGSLDRATYYEWVLFAFATELVALSKIAMHTVVLPPEARVAAIAEDGRRAWGPIAEAIASRVRARPWLVGDAFTAADAVVGGALWLAERIGVLGEDATLRAYYAKIHARPAFQRAFEDAR